MSRTGGRAALLKFDISTLNAAIISCCVDNKERKFQRVLCRIEVKITRSGSKKHHKEGVAGDHGTIVAQ